jgi:hypothetical protein
MLAELLDGSSGLAEAEDPLDAELAGASFVATAQSGEGAVAALADGLVPAMEAHGTRTALTLLTAISAVAGQGPERIDEAARTAVARLASAGVAAPSWADELAQPLTVGPLNRMYDVDGNMSILIGSFQRTHRGHALVIVIDHQDCGAAEEIYLVGEADLPTVVAGIHQSARHNGVTLKTKNLGAPEFRWYVEQALGARADHDAQDARDDADMTDDEGGPGYAPLAVLTRNRLAALPPARRPRGAVAYDHAPDTAPVEVLQQFAAALLQGPGGPSAFGPDFPAPRRQQQAKLSAKRKKSNGPAPVYQIKVSLRGAKPPIWRRLLVPGDITLNRLHHAFLVAFGWHGGHMYVFDTPYGLFGQADRELGHRSDGPVTLEQIAPTPKDKFLYTYDFGDDWEHEVLVEKATPADPAVGYPLCTGGRRAAPPDDCGGIWGYQELMDILADSAHPEHEDRLEWLGLTDARQFTPDAFDLDQVNQRLHNLR